MTKLYELADVYRTLQETDELTEEELKIALSNIEGLFNEKVLSIGKLINEEKAESDSIKKEIDRLTARKKAVDNRIDNMKDYLLTEMERAGINKPIKDSIISISLQSNLPSVKIIDEDDIPNKYFRIIPESREVDKKAILEAFKMMDATDWYSEEEPIHGIQVITDKKHIVIR